MRQRGCRLDPLMPEANAIDSTDSWTMPPTVSETDMAPPRRSGERACGLTISFSHKRDLLRDNGRDNKRRSMPRQLRSKLDSNPGTSAVLSCTWSPTAVSVRMTAKHFRVINGRGSENACEHGLVG